MAGTRDPDTLAPERSVETCEPDPTRLDTFGSNALASQIAMSARPATLERRMADAIRALAIDAVEQAGSGHSAMPMGMADAATALWTRHLRFDAADPAWPDRDRFVLSAGHGSMLLYALLHLTGHAGMGLDAIRRFRQLDSPAAGNPDHTEHPAIEATTGPIGQGLATAVGMALAERMMAARFGRSLVDHRTWVVAADGDLLGGLAHEAICLAGHLRLERLTVLWDDNGIDTDLGAAPGAAQDPLRHFAAAGWATRRIDGHHPAEIAASLAAAGRSRKPTVIACRTLIGLAAPNGRTGSLEAKAAIDWPYEPFALPDELAEAWSKTGTRGTTARRAWLKRLANHPLRAEFERVVAGRLPEMWHEACATLKTELVETRPTLPTRHTSQRTLEALALAIPELVGGAADPAVSRHEHPGSLLPVTPGNYAGRCVPFGVRGQAMAAALNGIALHGGLLPYAGTLLACSDEMRPALRLAALMKQRVVHVLTHDSIGVGQDGPTHQPVEHLASLRAIPGLHVLRPGDAVETVEAWELAIRRVDGPTLLVLTCQDVPALRTDAIENRCARGGYVLQEADGPRQATLVATGSEVAVAVEARQMLAHAGVAAAVVSLPCWELFAAQDEGYRAATLGTAPRFGIEAACGFGWERWLGPDGTFLGMTGFGASAPGAELFRHFGITADALAASVRKRVLPSSPSQQ